jgi:hypothetical protein
MRPKSAPMAMLLMRLLPLTLQNLLSNNKNIIVILSKAKNLD